MTVEEDIKVLEGEGVRQNNALFLENAAKLKASIRGIIYGRK